MIKKYMNQLYKEIEQIRRKIDSGKLRYFGDKDYGNAMKYAVLMKDSSYFYVCFGTRKIPKVNKRDIVFIEKMIDYRLSGSNIEQSNCEYLDSDRGFYRYNDYRDYKNYLYDKMIKYRVDFDKEIFTDYFD
jgi:hypothetical protein